MKKKILLVINTLSRAGAETALLELLAQLAAERGEDGQPRYELSLFVLMNQGELVQQIPEGVRLVNPRYAPVSVLEPKGRIYMGMTVVKCLLHRANLIRLWRYHWRAARAMRKEGRLMPDKLLWRAISDGTRRFPEEYDLAVAFLEGGSAYYVADHVRAKKKAAFIHIDYQKAGYSRELDRDCYLQYDAVFPIGEQVKRAFLAVYPECSARTRIYHNRIDCEKIRKMSGQPGGFTDDFNGIRLLTVGRLTPQKAYPVAIEAMRQLKAEGYPVRWYVLGEGSSRRELEQHIASSGLKEDFLLLGAVENPYPYYRQTDIYVHATGYEGKSIAIQEAQTLGCAIVASECNREQITDGEDGILCALDAAAVKEAVGFLIRNPDRRRAYAQAALKRPVNYENEERLLEQLLSEKE